MNRITTCPHCSVRLNVSEQITDKTLICPHCLAEMNNPRPGFQIPPANINTDVKRGLSVGSVVLALLIGLCVLGITFAYFASHEGESAIGRTLNIAMLFAALDVLVGIAIFRGLVGWSNSGVQTPSEGKILGIELLILGSIIAVIIFFFFTCSFLVG